MKKIFRTMLLLAIMMAACVSMGSCSSDDADGTFSEQRVENYIVGYKWYLDRNNRSEFRFYRNRLVKCEGRSSSVTSGMLTYSGSCFFGKWGVVNETLVTTFTSGTYGGFDWNEILYGSLKITNLQTNFKTIEATAPNGDTHELSSYMVGNDLARNDFTDYTDASSHDVALVGTWHLVAFYNKKPVEITMTIDKKGNVHFAAPSIDEDFTTTCTTKDGHVTFNEYITRDMGSHSFIYIREKEEIMLYNEKNAKVAWTWNK